MHNRKAFTLIELLVVIAIIAILAAILFPVFAQAKLAAKKAADLSNMKQIVVGEMVYLSDFDDTYQLQEMGTYGTGWPNTVNDWASDEVIGPYLKNTEILKNPVDGLGPDLTTAQWLSSWGQTVTRKTHKFSYMANGFTDWNWGGPNTCTAWGYHNPTGLMPWPAGTGSFSAPTSSTAVQQPAQVVAISDGQYEFMKFWGDWAVQTANNEFLYSPGYQYTAWNQFWQLEDIRLAVPADALYKAWRKFGGGSNFGFADGHAKYSNPDEMDQAKHWLINVTQ